MADIPREILEDRLMKAEQGLEQWRIRYRDLEQRYQFAISDLTRVHNCETCLYFDSCAKKKNPLKVKEECKYKWRYDL